MAHVAVVLAGCGRADGSEIHESVCVLIHLSRLGATYECFAPDQTQVDVINHATGVTTAESRNCMVEAARISRGKIAPIGSLETAEFDAVVFPGGFGVAKNLCTFAMDGENCRVNAEVERVLKEFESKRKPIGMCCIAPVIAARVFGTSGGGSGCAVTLGDDEGVAAAVSRMGSKHVVRLVTEALVDEETGLVTTPAYMYGDASPWQVFQGIGKMVEGTLALLKRTGHELPTM